MKSLNPVPLAMWQEIAAMRERTKHDDKTIPFSEPEAVEQIGRSYGYDAQQLAALGLVPAQEAEAPTETTRGSRPHKKRQQK